MMSGYPRWLRRFPGDDERVLQTMSQLANEVCTPPTPEPSTGGHVPARSLQELKRGGVPVGGSRDTARQVTEASLRLLKARYARLRGGAA